MYDKNATLTIQIMRLKEDIWPRKHSSNSWSHWVYVYGAHTNEKKKWSLFVSPLILL